VIKKINKDIMHNCIKQSRFKAVDIVPTSDKPLRFGSCFEIQRWTTPFSLRNDNGTDGHLKHGQSHTRYKSIIICVGDLLFYFILGLMFKRKHKYLSTCF
jgi:hypothetical protein